MISAQQLVDIISDMADIMIANKDYLDALDSAYGNGDHGTNMSRGFLAVKEKLPGLAGKDAGSILKAVGMTLVSNAGGTSGVLFGTAFMKGGGKILGKTEIGIDDLAQFLSEAIAGIKMRGKATVGEKTMLDAMVPAMESLESSVGTPRERLLAAYAAAEEGMRRTIDIPMKNHRIHPKGPLSIGKQDPGATSFTLMLSAAVKHSQ